ncbi:MULTISPECIES: class IV adenylate cyclase [Clostridium]|jgi:adenylate cyclase class 2|uniref:CYTH domain-containing protein n=3 Tax=Clostridium beijerinckii TaxID=1520 RepID=A0A1S8RAL1_CLOBE|nr:MULTISPECIES: CYTH domain-containing protein [Clostridium]ABR36649.1 adenylate cyclase [Clostridium beijerinckii NCIMB 8052]AIU01717.1 adenylate cyclase [Clostridium beijerinckii ATCC 35702]AVK48487.1 adenylate cyclase [Clostridium sp. MF28]MBE6091318.1 CYTH domain-containing protein [Clostridium beijerinckii]MBF7808706.1 CYTH domain-containing protein [Clostridium beijerinckii]
MQELETRIVDIDVENIRKILLSNGAEKVKMEDQVNDIYDFEDGRLLDKKGYARIRTINDMINNKIVYFMTTKKMLSQGRFKVMEENEVIIDNKTMGEGIFKSLGLVLKESNKKYRESYKLLDCLIEIDINDKSFCPFPYLEIETTSEEKLETVVKLLGYTLEDTTSQTIYDILSERGLLNNVPKGI